MTRAKMRKLINLLPPFMPQGRLDQALDKVLNRTTRTRLEARYHRRDSAR